jgi:radical SAM superfamily enzyme YgiQ (UPF0313 family)
MKILFVIPRWPSFSLWGKATFHFPYLALPLLASLTPSEFDIEIVDENIETIDFDSNPDIVAISLITPLAPRGYEIAEAFRKRGSKVVLGGYHPTYLPEEASVHADSVVIGEAEGVWGELLKDIKNGGIKKFYKTSRLSNLKNIPIPRRDLLKSSEYLLYNTLQTTRGCPFDCEFCSVTAFHGRSFRQRPIEDIEKEIQSLEQKGWRGRYIFIVDDNIVGDKRYALQLFRLFKEYNIKWLSQASITIASDDGLLKGCAESGCYGLFMGFESLNQETLNRMNKRFNRVSHYEDIINKIHDHGIRIQGSFIFGYDDDDRSIFDKTLAFVKKVKLDAIIFAVLTPYPGTKIYKRLDEEARILTKDWSLYDMDHVVFRPKGMTPEELQEGHELAYKEFYSLPSIGKRLFGFMRGLQVFLPMNLSLRGAWSKTRSLRPVGKRGLT